MAKDKKKEAKPKKEAKAKKEPKAKKSKGAKGEAPQATTAAANPVVQSAPPKDPKKRRAVLLVIVLALAAGVYFGVPQIKRGMSYSNAIAQIQKGKFETARAELESVDNYKDAYVLRTYALARALYGSGSGTSGAALDHVRICLQVIPEDYDGALANDIKNIKTQFGYYGQLTGNTGSDSALHGDYRSDVSHNGNFYTAWRECYESAAHFWDEPGD